MATGRRKVSLGLSDETHEEGMHVVYLYADDSERKRTMARFLQRGLLDSEKVLYLVHDISPSEMRSELCGLGVDAGTSQLAFDVMEAHHKHCPGQVFSREFMLGIVGRYYREALREGYVGARGAGEMSWAAELEADRFEELVRYEAELNEVLAANPLTTVCQYDVRRFPGSLLLDVLSVHPVAIVRGQIVQNPFFVPAEQFLRERRRARDAS